MPSRELLRGARRRREFVLSFFTKLCPEANNNISRSPSLPMLLRDIQQWRTRLKFCWEWKQVVLVGRNSCSKALRSRLVDNFWSTDIIELGLPFTDPIADGPTIQKSNTIALKNGVTVTSVLQMVRDARKKGLRAPVLFMGYYNPMRSYGEERLLEDCKEAGVNGFIVVDLPPEEAITFQGFCHKSG